MITIDQWKGLVTNASPYSIPPGAAVTQVNLQCVVPGQLNVRMGHATLSFSTGTPGATAVRSVMRYPNGNALIYSDSAGVIRAVTNPT